MCLGLFLATIETSITATALVSIGHHFNDSVTVLKSLKYIAFHFLIFAIGHMGCVKLPTLLYGLVPTLGRLLSLKRSRILRHHCPSQRWSRAQSSHNHLLGSVLRLLSRKWPRTVSQSAHRFSCSSRDWWIGPILTSLYRTPTAFSGALMGPHQWFHGFSSFLFIYSWYRDPHIYLWGQY